MSFKKWLRRPKSGRFIDELGRLVNVADILGRMQTGSDPFGNQWVAEYTPIIERKPLPALSDNRDIVEGAGTAAVSGGEINIDGTGGLTTLYTRDYGRYIPGIYSLAGIGIRFETPGTGTYEYGYGNGVGNRAGMEVVDGAYFTFVEAGGNRYYRKPRSEWLDPLDGTGPSGFMLNEEQHVFRIKIGWYGYLTLEFYIAVSDRLGGDRLVLIDRSEERSGVNLEQPDLPIFAEATGGILHVGGRQFGVLGRYKPEFRNTGGSNSLTGVGTSFVPVCSFQVKNTTAWRGTPVTISGSSVLVTDDAEVAIIIGGTLTGATFGSVPNIADGETALEFDTAATAVSGGYLAFLDNAAGGQGVQSGARGSDIPDLQLPRDTPVTLAVRALNTTTDVDGILRIREEW